MKHLLTIVIVLVVLTDSVWAVDVMERQAAMLETQRLVDAIPKSAEQLLPDVSPETQPNFWRSIREICTKAVTEAANVISSVGKTALSLLAIVTVCTLSSIVTAANASKASSLACALAIGLCCSGNLHSMVGLGKNTVVELSAFCETLIPVMGGAAVASGSFTASAALQAGTVFFLQLLVTFSRRFLVPAVYVYFTISLVGQALESPVFERLQKFINSLIQKSLKWMLLGFSAFLSLTGVISGTADTLAVKAAKAAVSTAVPVVGNMVSDASETVLISANLLKNSVGIFGMLAALSIMIVPFLKLAIHYLVLQVTEFICCAIGGKRFAAPVSTVSSAMGYLLALVGCCGIMTFLACVCFMKVASP